MRHENENLFIPKIHTLAECHRIDVEKIDRKELLSYEQAESLTTASHFMVPIFLFAEFFVMFGVIYNNFNTFALMPLFGALLSLAPSLWVVRAVINARIRMLTKVEFNQLKYKQDMAKDIAQKYPALNALAKQWARSTNSPKMMEELEKTYYYKRKEIIGRYNHAEDQKAAALIQAVRNNKPLPGTADEFAILADSSPVNQLTGVQDRISTK